ncbi:class I SAM-dependent methyltransferase [Diaphorobacter ruginosibacter]|uniref:Class I SAM-dependent methyltransferase n=1 Tax=Diaphorobacter ruginosibacter TaxID=1715720 RepID=A0A7G9RTG9_9BURK|nr:methyltransferase domain-containing protein [Diaphorobacter ruginosibacter]QNN58894.1 class I SAM-dependent methyltransferase [Diaphorobacter ruginosibacter]
MNGEIIGLHHWFDTPPGRYVLEWEQERHDELVADLFGYHALQLGTPRLAGLRANRMPHRWLALGQAQAMILERGRNVEHQERAPEEGAVQDQPAALLAEPVMLPFGAASLDLVLMPHALEDSPDPHAALREVERVLVPEGRVLISGFNPFSLWGMNQARSRLNRRLGVGGRFYLPEANRFISPARLRDWLQLLGFQLESISFGCYRPAVRTGGWLEKYEWLDAVGPRWWPILGAAYVIVATKRVQGMRLLGPSWRSGAAHKAPAPSQVPVAHTRQHFDRK